MNYITQSPLKIGEMVERYHRPEAGAIVLFSGDVRNHHQGRGVEYLEYESQVEMAQASIEQILNDAKTKWELHDAFAVHRIGRVLPGESSVVIITTSSHREEAYSANRYIIDRIKEETPIWKKEFFSGGSSVWH